MTRICDTSRGLSSLSNNKVSVQMIEIYGWMLSNYFQYIFPNRAERISACIAKLPSTVSGTNYAALESYMNTYKDVEDFYPYKTFFTKDWSRLPKFNTTKKSIAQAEFIKRSNQITQMFESITDRVKDITTTIVKLSDIINSSNLDPIAPLTIPPNHLLNKDDVSEIKKMRWHNGNPSPDVTLPITKRKNCIHCNEQIDAMPHYMTQGIEPNYLGYKHCLCIEATTCLKCCVLGWVLGRLLPSNGQLVDIENRESFFQDCGVVCTTCGVPFYLNMCFPCVINQ